MIICSVCGRDIDAIGQDNMSYDIHPICEDCAGKTCNFPLYEDPEKMINEFVDYIIEAYKKAGGKTEDTSRDCTYWTLKGIYDREGKEALEEFVRNWKPHFPPKSVRGYA